MALLLNRMHLKNKKIKGSSLVETLVATVIIVIVFGIASITLFNLMRSSVNSNTTVISNELHKLKYLYVHNQITIEDTYKIKNWNISLESNPSDSTTQILAKQKTNVKDQLKPEKTLVKSIHYAQKP